MKKKLLSLVIALMLVFTMCAFAACDGGSNNGGGDDDGGSGGSGGSGGGGGGGNVAVTSIVLDQTSLQFDQVGFTNILRATVNPSNATVKTLTWTSSDTDVVTVYQANSIYEASVCAIGLGTATITVSAPNDVSATCTVNVGRPTLTSITLNHSELEIDIDQTELLSYTIEPFNADGTITWSTSDENIATIREDGIVTGVNSGTATITATATNGVTATCEVTVRAPQMTFVEYGNGYKLTQAYSQTGNLTKLIIPETYNDKPVIAIDFNYGSFGSLRELSIPNTVSEINEDFLNRLNDSSVGTEYGNAVYLGNADNDFLWLWKALNTEITNSTVHGTAEHIAPNAFKNCAALESITIPDSVTTIGACAFQSCRALADVVIGNGVETIGNYAFSSAGVRNVTVGTSVTSIGRDAFANSSANTVSKVNVIDLASWFDIEFASEQSNPLYHGADFYLDDVMLDTLTVPEGVTEVKNHAFRGCSSFVSVTVGNDVEHIGENAFAYCESLETVVVGESVTAIEYMAFYSSTLKNVTIPFVGKGAVESSPSGRFAEVFHSSAPYDVITVTGGTEVASRAFGGNYAKEIVLADSIETIGDSAFANCSLLTTIKFGSGIQSIGTDAFEECNALNAIHVADIAGWCAVDIGEEYADSAFTLASNLYVNDELVTHLVIPEGVTEIKQYVFSGCRSIMSIYLPSTLQTIGGAAFRNCDKLVVALVGEGNTAINITPGSDIWALGDLNGYVKRVHTDATPTTMSSSLNKTEDNFWFYVDTDDTVYLMGYVGDSDSLDLPENYQGGEYRVHSHAFYNNDNIFTVTIHAAVRFAGVSYYQFNYCDNLITVSMFPIQGTFPQFYGCRQFTTVNFNGTMAEWNAIPKATFFDTLVNSELRIYCSDGVLDRTGTQVNE